VDDIDARSLRVVGVSKPDFAALETERHAVLDDEIPGDVYQRLRSG
jgi:hypothetical protein